MKTSYAWELRHAAPLFSGILLGAALRAFGCSFPIAYIAQVVTTLVVLVLCRRLLDLYPWRFVRGVLAIGVALGGFWYFVESHFEYPHFGPDNTTLMVRLWLESEPVWRHLLCASRALGFLILTPICEEVFFRGFMPRYLAGSNFTERAFRTTPWICYFASTLAFAALHREWIPALVFGLAMNELVRRSGSLWSCILAHAVANLSLACWHLPGSELCFK